MRRPVCSNNMSYMFKLPKLGPLVVKYNIGQVIGRLNLHYAD